MNTLGHHYIHYILYSLSLRILKHCRMNLDVHRWYWVKRRVNFDAMSSLSNSWCSFLILFNHLSRTSLYNGHLNKKWTSSSISLSWQREHILFSNLIFLKRPVSTWSGKVPDLNWAVNDLSDTVKLYWTYFSTCTLDLNSL